MRTFLMWREADGSGKKGTSGEVLQEIAKFFGPMFGPGLTAVNRSLPVVNLILLTQAVSGCRLEFYEEDEETRAQAVEYPLNAFSVLRARRAQVPRALLPALCRELERAPERVLGELAPPFSLIWWDKGGGQASLQVDGLGQAPVFEYDDGRLWAVTNHLMALRALGVKLEPVACEWAAWSAVGGWFPMNRTGFRGIARVMPGARFEVNAAGVRRTTYNVLADWIHPEARTADEWRETARWSVLQLLKEALRAVDDFDVGLSGGWDTRAVVSSLHALGANFRPRVKGPPESPDVIRASELARLAGLDLRITNDTEPPSDSAEDSARSVALALRWQAGEMDIDKHKTLFACGRRFRQARVNVMGQHGEIVRGRFYDKLVRENRISSDVPDEDIEEASVREYLKRLPPFFRRELRRQVREMAIESLRQADEYGLRGLARLDFHFLYEYTRRRNSASLASQNNLVVAPFLNPDIIRCCFGSSPADKAFLTFHRHIIETNAPGWMAVPFAQFAAPFEHEPPGKESDPVRAAEAFFVRTARDSRYYDAVSWWKTTGAPLLEAAYRSGGFLAEVCDVTAMKQTGTAAPDEVAVLSALAELTGAEISA